jgi:prepilin-type N-terminal cleavage/methylation domain-containing protein
MLRRHITIIDQSMNRKRTAFCLTKKIAPGFTLIEVIVVAVIIAVLSAVAIPLYGGYLRDARRDLAKNNCQLIGAAVMQAHNRGVTIVAAGWDTLIGTQDPSDGLWGYALSITGGTYPGSGAVDPQLTVKAAYVGTGPDNGLTVTFQPYQPPSSRWGGTYP